MSHRELRPDLRSHLGDARSGPTQATRNQRPLLNKVGDLVCDFESGRFRTLSVTLAHDPRRAGLLQGLGFEVVYEGSEFPGFLALRKGEATFGLQASSPEHPGYAEGMRWQFEVATTPDLDDVVTACRAQGLPCVESVETGGEAFRTRLVRVVSPCGFTVWFEGPNEA